MNPNSGLGGGGSPPGGSEGTGLLSFIPMGPFYAMPFIRLPLIVSFYCQYFPLLIQILAVSPTRRILSARL